jgi:hypothetical protein
VSVGNEPLLTRGGRFFSELNENVFTAAANLERSLGKKEGDNATKLKAGFYTERKDRSFDARFFGYVNGTTEQSQLPVDQVFRPENVTGNELDFSVQEEFNPLNSYSAANTLLAGYTSLNLPLGKKLNATVGFRGEFNQQELNSQDRSLRAITVNKPVFSPLPSLNCIVQPQRQAAGRLWPTRTPSTGPNFANWRRSSTTITTSTPPYRETAS